MSVEIEMTALPALKKKEEAVLSNLSVSLSKEGKFDEAADAARRALAINPSFAPAHLNLGLAMWGLGRYEDALASCRQAQKLRPDIPLVQLNTGILSLALEQYGEGWRGYAWRYAAQGKVLKASAPQWYGLPLTGKLFVWAEQGLGDEILYASMLPDLIARGIKVIWSVSKRLMPIFERSFPEVEFVAFDTRSLNMADVEAWITAPDLGAILRLSKDAFPTTPHLKVAPFAIQHRVVGISWASNKSLQAADKTSKLDDWANILAVPGVEFVNLQYDYAIDELASKPVTTLDGLDLKNDLEAVAQAVAGCDLVISISNSTAHLSCALGVPTWVLVPRGMGKFWYWGFQGETTPWYKSATVIRQKDKGNWRPTLDAVAERLAEHFA